MWELGERLRHAREAKGLTIEDLANRTKISSRYLAALEQGDFGAIPGRVYLRGFLHNYATAVGLDPRVVLDELNAKNESVEPTTADEPVIRLEKRTESQPPRVIAWWQPALVGGALVLAVCLILAMRGGERNKQEPERSALPREQIAGGASAAATESPEPDTASLTLTLRYSARCWARIFCDGEKVFEGTMNEGAVQRWSAGGKIEVMLGNAGGVRGELNGKELPPFGATGIRVTRVFEADRGS